ncbi:MAG: transglutaminase-like domain-containing protein [Clostridia bacterium]|nr:transglutaminase-like domain-containing protein [Clostridia bacterium]
MDSSLRREAYKRWRPMAALLLAAVLSVTALSADALNYPEASGKKTLKAKKVTADISNVSRGYFMIKHSGTSKKLKMILYIGKNKIEQYDMDGNGEYNVFPLTRGSGTYKIEVYENTSKKNYAKIFTDSFKATIDDPNEAFLFPNRLVNYKATSNAVAKSQELCAGLTSDEDKVKAVWDFLAKNMVYDYIKAATVKSGYVPDVDLTLSQKRGICFDYSSLYACMLRSQGIPTRLVVGNLNVAGNSQYHAWNSIYLGGKWVHRDATFAQQSYSEKNYSPMYIN